MSTLAEWIREHLQLEEVLEEAPVVDETALPAASIRFERTREGDTLDNTLIASSYQVGLFAPVVGTEATDSLPILETRLMRALQSPARAASDWEHIEGEAIERGPGWAVWRITVYTRGEG